MTNIAMVEVMIIAANLEYFISNPYIDSVNISHC